MTNRARDLRPGWKWSEQRRARAGTKELRVEHVGMVFPGCGDGRDG